MRGDVRFWHLEWYGCYQWCSEGWNCRHHSASRWAPNQCQWTHCALEVPPLVKLSRTQASQLAGLKDVVIPVEVETSSMKISIQVRGGKTVERTVRRRQYPVTTAYSFDYCSQGQTIPYIIVDITKPPSGTLTLFNLYIALSQSSGWDTIRLLWDFDEIIPTVTWLGSHGRGWSVGRTESVDIAMVAEDGHRQEWGWWIKFPCIPVTASEIKLRVSNEQWLGHKR